MEHSKWSRFQGAVIIGPSGTSSYCRMYLKYRLNSYGINVEHFPYICESEAEYSLVNKVFICSKNPESSTFDSSMIKQVFSPLQPARCSTVCKSSPKSSPVYLFDTLIWKILRPFIQATNCDRVVCEIFSC